MSKNRYDSSNIKSEIDERNRLQEYLTELSIQAMGTDRDGTTKNNAQILAVIQSLYEIQQSREQFEHARAAENLNFLNLKKITSIRKILTEKKQEFKYLVTKCLESYSVNAQELASEYLENVQALFEKSSSAINSILDETYQTLPANSEPDTQIETNEHTNQQEQIRRTKIIHQIQNNFGMSHQRAAELIKKLTDDLTLL